MLEPTIPPPLMTTSAVSMESGRERRDRTKERTGAFDVGVDVGVAHPYPRFLRVGWDLFSDELQGVIVSARRALILRPSFARLKGPLFSRSSVAGVGTYLLAACSSFFRVKYQSFTSVFPPPLAARFSASACVSGAPSVTGSPGFQFAGVLQAFASAVCSA